MIRLHPEKYLDDLKARRIHLKKKIKKMRLFKEDSNLKRQKENNRI